VRPGFDLSLYLVTDRSLCAHLGIEQVVEAAVRGGVTLVQLRDDQTPTSELIDVATRLRRLLERYGVPLIVNNRLDVALAAGAAGAHVGQSDASPVVARRRLGPDAILGLSITDLAQLAAVDPAIVDYLGVGPVFATGTKPDAAPAMGLQALAAARAATSLPIVAIGGIDQGNAAEVMRTGVAGIAVVSAICAAPDPQAAARALAGTVARTRRPLA
jgi:thiamine-phosphate pyrophosphorylase